jgi:NADH-quinone oxidoreductase subunit H
MGAARGIAQVLSYEVPITFVVLSIVVLASSMNLTGITLAQYSKYGIFGWYWLPCILGFGIMFICTLAELNRCPFDLPEAESELICGYNTEYSGMRFALFYLSEYALLFVSSLFLAIMFLGGYLSPFGTYLSYIFWGESSLANILVYFEQAFWLILKASLIIFVIIWIRATLPRLASFDLLKFSWAVLLPLSIFNLFLMTVLKYLTGGVLCALS